MDERDWMLPGYEPTADLAGFAAQIARLHPRVIAIDGALGAGKSHLAATLGAHFGSRFTVVEIDDFLPAPGGDTPYVDRLDLARLQAVAKKVLATEAVLCAEGVCVRDVMERIGVPIDCSIYVVEISLAGIWHYGRIFGDDRGFDEEASAGVAQRSVASYHRGRLPHSTSTFTFVRRSQEQERDSAAQDSLDLLV